jgi:HAE1 family hydrophobic/amphiphilic exporter-1
LDGGYGNSWTRLGNGNFSDASAGLSISIPLGRRAARGEVSRALAARGETGERLAQTRARIAFEVANAVTAVQTAAERIDAARAGLTAAETQLRAEQERFAAGIGSNFLVLTRQSELATAQLAELTAIADHSKALVELGRAAGTLIRDRGIELFVLSGTSNSNSK